MAGETAPDGEDLDAYVLGVDRPLDIFRGLVIAVIHREDDVEDKLVVAPEGCGMERRRRNEGPSLVQRAPALAGAVSVRWLEEALQDCLHG